MASASESLIASIRDACISHSADLLEVARLAGREGKANIAFHLALLALEELGKLHLHAISRIHDARGEDGKAFFDRHANDHVAKLFWAFWGYKLAGRMTDRAEFDKWREFARDVHSQRLAGLYAQVGKATVSVPRLAVTEETATSLIELAESYLELERATEETELTGEARDSILWLRSAAESEDTRRLVFSRLSMEKLRDAKDVSDWIAWLRRTVEEEEAEVRALVHAELSRVVPKEGSQARWFCHVDLLTPTHSVRSKALTEWNARSNMLKLRPAGKKSSALRVEVTLLDNTRADDVHRVISNLVSHFVIALNISSTGFFWPYLPEQSFPLFSTARDLKHRRDLDIRRQLYATFRLIEDQRERRVLTLDDVARAGLLFSFLPFEKDSFVQTYWSGLAILAKSDPLLRLERQAFEQFRTALEHAMKHYEPAQDIAFADAFRTWAKTAVGDENAVELSEIARKDIAGEITFHDAVNMKVCFDLYVLFHVMKREMNGQHADGVASVREDQDAQS